MLHRIEMNIVHVRGIIAVVTDRVFPEPMLPNPALFTPDHDYGSLLHRRKSPRKRGFDQAPAIGIIGIVFRERPKAMHMLGKHDPGIDVKLPFRHYLTNGI